MRAIALLAFALLPALAVRVEWLSPRPGVYPEGRVLVVEARVEPEPGERVLEVRGVALPSGREVFRTTSLQVKRYWDTTGFGGTTALRLEVDYTGGKTGTAYALLALQVQGTGLSGQNLQAQGLMEDLDGFITQACRFIGFYELASVRWLCTAHRTVKKAVNYWNQLGEMWEDFKNQAIYYGTGLALDWLGKGLGLHQLNPLVDQVDQALTDFMSDIRRQKNAILNALARARAEQLRELDEWKPGDDPLYWGPEWWTRLLSGVVPQLGFQATTQSLTDLQRTAQLLENQSRVAQNVQNQQENLSLENTLQDLWDTLGAAWNFIAEAVSKGWASLTGGLSGASVVGAQSASPGASLGAQQTSGTSGSGGSGGSGSGSVMDPGITERLISEAQTAPSTREVMEVVVKGFAELIRLQAQDSFRAVQEMKNLAAQQAMTVEQLVQVNQNLVELIRKQEASAQDQLRALMAQVASQAEKTSAKYVAVGEALELLARQWKAETGTPPPSGGSP
ncbi:hypothetical protein TthSNM11_10530 [Thermus thermophilus]|uniref:hypothetical protein n=1 Tax=Thermus thermophilus TaxID=274 RepID=UPI001FCD9913|nr:hypothetical protein [Thermus thermophilus]BDG18850.1 hypothetical protein TthSNM11_10530 [Thermus thermophilus]